MEIIQIIDILVKNKKMQQGYVVRFVHNIIRCLVCKQQACAEGDKAAKKMSFAHFFLAHQKCIEKCHC